MFAFLFDSAQSTLTRGVHALSSNACSCGVPIALIGVSL